VSGGSNGLKPHEVLARKDKCPDSPSKHRYQTADEAWAAARERSKETGLEIVAYLCAGCGYSHLTKNSKGSDVIARTPIGVTTGAARKKLAAVPTITRPARVNLEVEEGPIVPGNKDARRKVLAQYLTENPEPAMAELQAAVPSATTQTLRTDLIDMGYMPVQVGQRKRWVMKGRHLQAVDTAGRSETEKKPRKPGGIITPEMLAAQEARREKIREYLQDRPSVKTKELIELIGGVASSTVRKDMERLGWVVVGMTQSARWVRPEDAPKPTEDQVAAARSKHTAEQPPAEDEVVQGELVEEQELERAVDRHPAGTRQQHSNGWHDMDVAMLGDMPLSQVLTVLRATGLDIRFQVH
jgi:hypothetical protein